MNYRIPLITSFFFVISLPLLFQGCISDTQLEGYPTVSFTTEVQPILAANCTQSGCHDNTNSDNFSLVTYGDVIQHVTPGNGRKSSIYRSITGRSLEGFMPPDPASPLTEDQIRSIFVWIEQGALNN